MHIVNIYHYTFSMPIRITIILRTNNTKSIKTLQVEMAKFINKMLHKHPHQQNNNSIIRVHQPLILHHKLVSSLKTNNRQLQQQLIIMDLEVLKQHPHLKSLILTNH